MANKTIELSQYTELLDSFKDLNEKYKEKNILIENLFLALDGYSSEIEVLREKIASLSATVAELDKEKKQSEAAGDLGAIATAIELANAVTRKYEVTVLDRKNNNIVRAYCDVIERLPATEDRPLSLMEFRTSPQGIFVKALYKDIIVSGFGSVVATKNAVGSNEVKYDQIVRNAFING